VTAHLVVLLAVVHTPADRVVAEAAAQALVAPFIEPPRLIVRTTEQPPGAKRLAGLLREGDVQAVVAIACEGPGCSRVTLEVRRRDGQSLTRVLRFDARDDLAQRGRAVGLLASTLLPEDWERRGADSPPAPVVAAAAPPPPLPSERLWTAQATGLFFVPTATVRADLGLFAAVRRHLFGGLEAGAALRLERGGLETEPGDFFGAAAGLSAAWLSSSWRTEGRFRYGARLDLLALRRRLRHEEPTEVELHDYWAFGADLGLLAGYGLSTRTTLVAGIGLESFPFTIAIPEHDRAAHRLSQYRVMFDLGVFFGF
jgi:hypothetical protein